MSSDRRSPDLPSTPSLKTDTRFDAAAAAKRDSCAPAGPSRWRRATAFAGRALARAGRQGAPAVSVAVLSAFLLANGPVNGPVGSDQLILKHDLSREKLLRNFDIIVFRNEFNDRVDTRLRKWVDPIRVYLDVRAGDPALMQSLVADHLRNLSELTGHDIALVRTLQEANVVVAFERDSNLDQVGIDYFESGFDIAAIMQSNVCYGRYHANTRNEIFRAVIVIPTDRAMSRGRLPACIVEELTQVLGLPNDSEEVFPSIFNDKSIDEDLSKQDKILVRLLYDPRLRPGMARTEVLRRVRAILEEMDLRASS